MSQNKPSLYWYDLETSGIEARWDRIVQVAGMRTDLDLNPLGDEFCTYVALPDDVLPSPAASLVTGITPPLTVREGITEWQALSQLQKIFAQPQTCVAGFNSLRFDDEFIRFGFYRLLLDPYAREWQNGNSRWDIIDLVRATGALRRDGIEWPTNEEGLPVYNLELMTRANNLEHGNAHDAMSDVRATIALARLLKKAQPRLFQYYFDQRSKKRSRSLLEPYGERVCLHVSGMYPRERYCAAPVVSICRHPTNANSIVVADLHQDIDSLLTWQPEEIGARLFESGHHARPPLKEVRVNRAPFLAGIEVLTDENWSRLGYDRKIIKERARRLRAPGIAQKIARVYRNRTLDTAADADAALYDAFLQDRDRDRCASLQRALAQGEWLDLDYEDARLKTLAPRLKARSFRKLLTPQEEADWVDTVRTKLHARDVPWRTLAGFRQEIASELAALNEAPDPRRQQILAELEAHADMLEGKYPA
jgi:exodeoxyribonuclease I